MSYRLGELPYPDADTFLLTLPDGKQVRCWTKDREAIRLDVYYSGDVFLMRPAGADVYERVPPHTVQAVVMENDDNTRRVS